MLVGAFEIHHRLVAAVRLAPEYWRKRKRADFQYERMRRAGIEPDVEKYR